MTRAKIGIVDDEVVMRDALVALLIDNQFDAVPMSSIDQFWDTEQITTFDLVIIDLHLGDESGLSLAMDVRAKKDVPIIMLTGKGDETDKIVGLEVGADDYILKPFNPRELVARVRAVLRRYGQVNVVNKRNAETDELKFGRLIVDQKQRILVDENQKEISLTNAEYRLLDYFLSRPNEIIPRSDLLTNLGSDLTRHTDRTIDVIILRLRRKIEANPSKPVHLQTRRGQGYIFVTQSPDEPV